MGSRAWKRLITAVLCARGTRMVTRWRLGVGWGCVCYCRSGHLGKAVLMEMFRELRPKAEKVPCEQQGKRSPGGRKSRYKGPSMSWKNGGRPCGQECSEQGERKAGPMLEREAGPRSVVPEAGNIAPWCLFRMFMCGFWGRGRGKP